MFFVGVDGGGSKCRALIIDESGNVVGEGLGGPANPLHGYQQTLSSVMTAVHQAQAQAQASNEDLQESTACLGLAGVNLPSLLTQMNAWDHPFRKMFLETDLHIACRAAHDGGDGAVIITGTGSCGVSIVDGKERILGAHGFPVGDKASGAWLGLEALRYYLLAVDGFVPHTLIQEALQQHYQTNDPLKIIEQLAGKASAHYAKLAKLVFDCARQGDEAALHIVHDGANYLSMMIRFLNQSAPPRITMLGGLAPIWRDWLPENIVKSLSPALISPQLAAAKLARHYFHTHFALEQSAS